MRKDVEAPRPDGNAETPGDRGARRRRTRLPRPGPREAFRRKLRSGELDDKEIELQVAGHLRAAPSDHARHPRHARRRRHGHASTSATMLGKAFGGARQTRRRSVNVSASYDGADGRGEPTSCSTRITIVRATPSRRSSRTASSSSTRSTRSAPRPNASRRRRCQPRGRPARPPAADRGHHRLDQARRQSRPTTSCSLPRAPSTSPSRRTCCPNCRGGCRSASN